MGRAERLTTELKKHDPKLYCDKSKEGTLCVYRESHCFESFLIGDNILTNVRPSPHFIFALTDNWKTNGKAIDWGIEPVMARIRSIDSWHRDVAQDLIKDYEKDEASRDRAMDNHNEAFLKDFRPQFAKAFNDVNTANLRKIDKRRLRDGNHK